MVKGADVFTITLAPLALKHNFSFRDFKWGTYKTTLNATYFAGSTFKPMKAQLWNHILVSVKNCGSTVPGIVCSRVPDPHCFDSSGSALVIRIRTPMKLAKN
jgi:hypothetical protein